MAVIMNNYSLLQSLVFLLLKFLVEVRNVLRYIRDLLMDVQLVSSSEQAAILACCLVNQWLMKATILYVNLEACILGIVEICKKIFSDKTWQITPKIEVLCSATCQFKKEFWILKTMNLIVAGDKLANTLVLSSFCDILSSHFA